MTPGTESGPGKVGIVVIHGMGDQGPGFELPLKKRIHKELQTRGTAPTVVPIEPIYWQDVLKERQADYLLRASQAHRLDHGWLRRWVVQVIGDPAAYQPFNTPGTTAYEEIHNRVESSVRRLRRRVASEQAPLIVLAHSLGGQVMSNYIWDLQRGRVPSPADSFEAFHTLAGMVTFGCNIPLFALAHDPIIPIVFPGPGLTQRVKDSARWWNMFDRDDVLAYPLRPVSRAYDQTVDADIELVVGPLLQGWSPLSHGGYWRSSGMVRRIVNLVESLMDRS